MATPTGKSDHRKQTEELLAGFDRTGRTPKTPPVKRDFVDFHQQRPERVASTPRVAKETFVIQRGGKVLPGWVVWGGAVLLMLGGGALVAYLVAPSAPPLKFTPVPSAVTTSAAPSAVAAPLAETSAVVVEPPAPSMKAAEPAVAAPSASVRPRPATSHSDFARSL